jgi:hypothetical protein
MTTRVLESRSPAAELAWFAAALILACACSSNAQQPAGVDAGAAPDSSGLGAADSSGLEGGDPSGHDSRGSDSAMDQDSAADVGSGAQVDSPMESKPDAQDASAPGLACTTKASCNADLDTVDDPANCGACGAVCAPLEVAGGSIREVVNDSTSLYWVDGTNIKKAPLSGGEATTLVTGSAPRNGIAVFGDSLYYVDDTALMKVKVTGGSPTAIAPNVSANEIAVAATGVYWWGASGIMKVALDGSAPTILVPNVSSYYCSKTTIVTDASHFYYEGEIRTASGGQGCGLIKVPLDGGTPVTIVSGSAGINAFAVSSKGIYWSSSGSLSMIPPAGDEHTRPTILFPGKVGDTIGDMAVTDSDVYWTRSGSVMKMSLADCAPVQLATARGFAESVIVNGTDVYWVDYFWQGKCPGCDLISTVGCRNRTCRAECRSGEARCAGITLQSCGAAGSFVDGTACPSACVGGQCVQGTQCNFGDARCAGDSSRQVCLPDGTWGPPGDCDPNATCSAGHCNGPQACNSLALCCDSIKDSFTRMTCLNISKRGTGAGCQSQLDSFRSANVCS